jgi:hypothetical protein
MTAPRVPLLALVAALLALVAGMLAIAPDADAERRPTTKERRAIANAVGVPKRCLVTRVSTVDERWSVAWLKRCDLGGGSAVFRFKRGLWRDSYTGPNEPRAERCSRIDFVRAKVARDLELCR